ncbi:hypothetical protein E2562_002090 [Oryza meyeriana var. granulata]|uniref:ABC transporter domain-containing protein n=1 Tax=Oryza meyeriana var. granulata TaxID=110450 RepID=A0A6G1EDG5_9ORYZ|nr:hypothetical protein E2562_002090 [Oryza meyeriana var. granulata]
MEDLSSELDPALLSTSTSSSSPPDSASPSFSFYHPSPPNYTLAVSNLSCRDPRRGSGAGLLSFLGSSSSSPVSSAGGGLLNNVSFTASSSQILAVVGPSGAGKSTLLRILSGRGTGDEIAKPHTVSVNGHAVTSRAQLRRMCGFVTQDDNLLPLLTVRETILFAARFRLRSAVTARERGERPTSGLDSRSAMDVLALLRDVARARRQVVVLSIHQPSYRMLGYISSLLLLSRGAVAHFGALKSLEDALSRLGHKIPMQLNPLELAMEVTEQLEADHARFGALTTSSQQHTVRDVDDDEEESSDGRSGGGSGGELVIHAGEHGYYCSRTVEVVALTVRCWRTMHRTKELFAARAAQARSVLMREASRRAYRLSSYVVANAIVFAPCLLAVSLLFSGPVYFLAGLRATVQAFAFFALAVWLIVLMASSLVLFLSAVSPDFILGNSLICISLGVFFLFSGYFIPRESIPRYWAFMYYVSMYRYPLDLLLINEVMCWVVLVRRAAKTTL